MRRGGGHGVVESEFHHDRRHSKLGSQRWSVNCVLHCSEPTCSVASGDDWVVGGEVVQVEWNRRRKDGTLQEAGTGRGGAMKGNRPAQPPHSPLDNDNLRHFYTW